MDWYRGSLLQPDVDDGADAEPPESCLLGRKPFFGKRTNATTAICTIDDDLYQDVAIQVSFFTARPPLVSYILAWSTGTYFTQEPSVLSTDGGVVLLSFAIFSASYPLSEYYIYRPSVPSLDFIPQPTDRRLVDDYCTAGLLSHGPGSSGYHIVTLTREANGEFDLYVFSSDSEGWAHKKPVLAEDVAANLGNYMTYRAIPLGGGSMAFVDLWNCILICDVLHGGDHPELHYLQLLSTGLCKPSPKRYPLSPRDIAIEVSKDTIRIKLAEVVYPLTSEAWCTDTWIATTVSTSPWRLGSWRKESTDGSELSVAEGLSLDGLLDSDTLGSLFVDRPMLSLGQDNVVCFLAKRRIEESQAWVISVDMANKKLQGVNRLEVGRSKALFYSTISSHLNMTTADAGAKGDLKRHGALLESYPQKKPHHLPVVSSWVGESDMGAHDGKAVDSEQE